MRKCGIATITNDDNYGNRLQNYALQQIVGRFGFEPETILYRADIPLYGTDRTGVAQKLRQWRSAGDAAYDVRRILRKRLNSRSYAHLEQARCDCFRAFTAAHLTTSDREYGALDDLSVLDSRYDVFVAGSDQIWNPYYEGTNPFYFLSFARKSKRIAYASSFGVSDIPAEQRPYYSALLNGLRAISVREDRGRELIEELTGRSAEVLPDPTMLLTREEWLAISKEADGRPEGGYLLSFFLGKDVLPVRRAVTDRAKALGLPVVSLNDPGDPRRYTAGPAEFLDLIGNASAVCTDSFHGCVFSLIFNRPLIVFDRLGPDARRAMNSRIETLAKDFGVRNASQAGGVGDLLALDFGHVNRVMQRKRDAAFRYLKNAFDSIGDDENE